MPIFYLPTGDTTKSLGSRRKWRRTRRTRKRSYRLKKTRGRNACEIFDECLK
jgi:hypothetical protein